MDDIEQLLQAPQEPQDNNVKERLVQVVISGKSKEYLGKQYSTNEIESLDEKDLAKLYARYEGVLGGLITKTLKRHICNSYTKLVEFFCPAVSNGKLKLEQSDELAQQLNEGPFIDLALTSLTCQMYHKYGHFLAPFEVAILTSNFVKMNLDESSEQQVADQKLELKNNQSTNSN